MQIQSTEAVLNSRRATWHPHPCRAGRPRLRAYITVPLVAEDAAIALHLPIRDARKLVQEDPGYLLVAQRWFCPN
jgi:hypothetical protein